MHRSLRSIAILLAIIQRLRKGPWDWPAIVVGLVVMLGSPFGWFLREFGDIVVCNGDTPPASRQSGRDAIAASAPKAEVRERLSG